MTRIFAVSFFSFSTRATTTYDTYPRVGRAEISDSVKVQRLNVSCHKCSEHRRSGTARDVGFRRLVSNLAFLRLVFLSTKPTHSRKREWPCSRDNGIMTNDEVQHYMLPRAAKGKDTSCASIGGGTMRFADGSVYVGSFLISHDLCSL